MPNGNINSDALDSLFDPKGNVVLEQFEDSAYGTTAVLLRPESAAYRAQTGLGDPYVVAYGYDKETGEWSHGYYTSNLSYAVDRANPEILEEATIKWQREDFEAALEEKGLEPSKRNTEALIQACGKMQGWKDWATVGGNETIEDAVRDGNFERDPELAIDGIKEKPDLDSSMTMSYGFKEIIRQIDDARKVQDMSRDPFGSHDGMDIDPRTAVVETCGYGYRNEVCDDVREAFRQDIEDEQQINELKRENYEQEAR